MAALRWRSIQEMVPYSWRRRRSMVEDNEELPPPPYEDVIWRQAQGGGLQWAVLPGDSYDYPIDLTPGSSPENPIDLTD